MLSGFNFSRAAEKSFSKLQRTNTEDSKAIWLRLDALLANPRPRKAVRIAGYGAEMHRIRVGAYRIIYATDGETLHVGVIERRDKAYQQLATLVKSGTWPPAAE